MENALSASQLNSLNTELDVVAEGVAPGLRHPSHEDVIEFYGHNTIRLDGLPARSETFREIMTSQPICGVADELLLPNCDDYLLNTGQLIQIGPGETGQFLHRDDDAWAFFKPPKPLLQVEAMFALTDFTQDNGSYTRGSRVTHMATRARAEDRRSHSGRDESGFRIVLLGYNHSRWRGQ